MCTAYDAIVKDFQSNLASFVNVGFTAKNEFLEVLRRAVKIPIGDSLTFRFFQAAQTLSICTQNLAKIMGNVDPNQTIVNKSVPALLDWGQ